MDGTIETPKKVGRQRLSRAKSILLLAAVCFVVLSSSLIAPTTTVGATVVTHLSGYPSVTSVTLDNTRDSNDNIISYTVQNQFNDVHRIVQGTYCHSITIVVDAFPYETLAPEDIGVTVKFISPQGQIQREVAYNDGGWVRSDEYVPGNAYMVSLSHDISTMSFSVSGVYSIVVELYVYRVP